MENHELAIQWKFHPSIHQKMINFHYYYLLRKLFNSFVSAIISKQNCLYVDGISTKKNER